jgi:hypothetical protein
MEDSPIERIGEAAYCRDRDGGTGSSIEKKMRLQRREDPVLDCPDVVSALALSRGLWTRAGMTPRGIRSSFVQENRMSACRSSRVATIPGVHFRSESVFTFRRNMHPDTAPSAA